MQDRNGRCFHEPIYDQQAEIHICPPADFCGFGLEHAVPIHPNFEPCPLNENDVRWWNDHSSSHLPVIEYTDVDHCGLMCLKTFIEPRRSSWTWSLTNVKTILLKTRKPFSCHSISDGTVPIHGVNVCGRLRCFRPSIELKEKNMSEMFQFLNLALHFLASLTHFKWQNFNM